MTDIAIMENALGRVFPHLLIRASAGSGKTFQLSNRYLGLLAAGVAPDSILAATFTRKAAGEILDRIVLRLAEGTQSEAAATELGGFIGDASLNQERCLDLLAEFATNLHRTRVGTLDGFFAQLAGSFSLELGLPPGWRITEPLEDRRLRDEAIESVLKANTSGELSDLTHLLSKGASARGVGSLIRGTVDSLYNVFLETGVDPAPWHCVPRKKALPKHQLESLCHLLGALDMGDKRLTTARDADVELILEENWSAVISKGLTKKIAEGVTTYYKKEIPEEALELYRQVLEEAKAHLVGLVAHQTEGTYTLLNEFHSYYEAIKTERQGLRFEDITRRLTDTSAIDGMSEMTYRLDADIDHLLLDEFQDTSPAQWRVLRPFAQRVTETSEHRSFFCVGDVKQAIYGWRGGVAEIFDAVSDEINGLTTESLATSYRSSPVVIEAVNEIFAGLSKHPKLGGAAEAVSEWRSQMEEHTTAKTDLPGYARFEAAEFPLQRAAEVVADIVKQDPRRSVGVLLRSNQGVGQMIARISRLGVQASEEGGNPLTDSAAVLTVLSLLKLTDHPGDGVARFHVANSVLGEHVGLTTDTDPIAAGAAGQVVRRALLDHGYGAALFQWAQVLAPQCNARELSRLLKLVELAYDFEPQASLRAADFIAYVEQQRVSDPTAANVRVMTIHQSKGLEFDVVVLPELAMNFPGHADEFVVHRETPTAPITRVSRYASSAIQQLFPADIRQMFDDAVDKKAAESLCVLYVAITRPIHSLYMFTKSKPEERSLPKTIDGMLRAALSDGKPVEDGDLIWDHGDPDWLAKLPPVEVTRNDNGKEQADLEPLTITLRKSSEPHRGRQRVSPSRIDGRPVTLSHALGGNDLWRLRRGEILHAWMSRIGWLADDLPENGLPSDAEMERIAKKIGAGELNVPELMSEFKQLVGAPKIADLLTKSHYDSLANLSLDLDILATDKSPIESIEVFRERRFAIGRGQAIVEGVMDRMVQLNGPDGVVAADIVDFKSEEVTSSAAIAGAVERYRPQLEAYREAASLMFQLPAERISIRLAFLHCDEIVAIHPQVDQVQKTLFDM